MTFLSAVLEGCKTTRQAFRSSHSPEEACVLQAAEIGAGLRPTLYPVNYSLLLVTFPVLGVTGVTCPECGLSNFALMCAAFHLNDDHCWPRERTAAWVDTYEQPVPEPERETEAALLSIAYPNRMRRVEVSDIELASEHCEDATADIAAAILHGATVEGL